MPFTFPNNPFWFSNQIIICLLFLQYPSLAQNQLHYLSSTTGAASYTLEYHQNYLYSGEGNTFSVYNVGIEKLPPYKKVFEYRSQSFIDDIIIEGDKLYLASNTNGILKWDISQPEQPTLLAHFIPESLDEAAYDIAVKGDTLFVAYKTKLAVFKDLGDELEWLTDIYNTNNPFARIRGCAVKDSILAFTVATMNLFPNIQDGVHIYNANDLSALSFFPETFGDGEDLIFGQNHEVLHVLGGGQLTSSFGIPDPRGHFYSLDMTDPAEPNRIFTDTIPGISLIGDSQVIAGDISNDTLYIATRTGYDEVFPLEGNVFVYDATDPDDIHFLNFIDVGLLHFDVALQNEVLHVASEWFGVRSIDVLDLSSPINLGDTHTGGWNKSADIFEDRMVLANEGYGIQLFDIAEPANPELIATHINISNGFNFNVNFSKDGQYVFGAYIPGFDEFRVFDAETLDEVASGNFYTGYDHTFVYQDVYIAYVSAGGIKGVTFTDVSNPLDPELITKLPMTINDQLMSEQGKLFISRNDSLLVLDLNNNFEKVFALEDSDGNGWQSLAMYKDTLYVYREGLGLYRYFWEDASNVLTFNDFVALPLETPTHLAVDSFGLYIGYTEFGLFAYDRNSLTELDYYRTGLDFIFPHIWDLEELKTKDGLIMLIEYFGQTTLLTMNDKLVGNDVERFSVLGDFKVYPNPLSEALNIELNNEWIGEFELIVYNALGQVVYQNSLNKTFGKQVWQIDLSNLESGLYSTVFFHEGKSMVRKFVKE